MAIQELKDGDSFANFRTITNNNFKDLKESTEHQVQVLKDNGILVCGVYTGDGADTRTISLGFMPIAVIIANKRVFSWVGLALQNNPVVPSIYSDSSVISIVSNGFKLQRQFDDRVNVSDNEYYFIAFRAGSIVEK